MFRCVSPPPPRKIIFGGMFVHGFKARLLRARHVWGPTKQCTFLQGLSGKVTDSLNPRPPPCPPGWENTNRSARPSIVPKPKNKQEAEEKKAPRPRSHLASPWPSTDNPVFSSSVHFSLFSGARRGHSCRRMEGREAVCPLESGFVL